MEKTDIAALLDALCERPFADGQVDGAQVQAFCREAAKALSQGAGAPAGSGTPSGADAEALTAALAALVSNSDAESARRTIEEAMLRSSPARLDAQSALAFIDALLRSPQTAPAHLVEELLAGDRAAAGAMPREGAGRSALRTLIAGASWSARRWRVAAACTVVILGGVASSTYWQQIDPAAGNLAQPVERLMRAPPAPAQAPVQAPARAPLQAPAYAPAPARPALATAQPCETRSMVGESGKATRAETRAETKAKSETEPEAGIALGAAKPAESSAEANCAAEPQRADHPADAAEARAARLRAEADRQAAAAAARAAAEAASNADAARAGRSGPGFGAASPGTPPAAAPSAPPAAPATRPAAPLGTR